MSSTTITIVRGRLRYERSVTDKQFVLLLLGALLHCGVC